MSRCPCQSGLTLQQCCGPLLADQKQAVTAEQLMRSRFAAYSLRERDYLLKTWHADFRPAELEFSEAMQWIALQIVDHQQGQQHDEKGMVHFRAYFKHKGKVEVLEEKSQFLKTEGKWQYLNGELQQTRLKISRNDPCPCGSGKKFKRCCL